MQRAGHLEEEDAVELISQSKAGSHAAFEAIYRMHLGRVYAICLRILADRTWAEEVTQKIFVRAWTKLNSFRGESRFSSWLYRLSVNVILGELKLAGARKGQTLGGNDMQRLAASGSELSRNLHLDLGRAIDLLPQQARIIFVLHDIEGFTHVEIADVMELAAGTCKAQLSRARRLLREALKR
jgi:RNA polymerase sigma-70 factor (ECF subfamily)